MIADTAPVMIWISGTDTRRISCNKRWLDFTGRTMEQERGLGWADGVHPEDHQRCVDTYLGAFRSRQRCRTQYRLRRADGQYRWFLDTAVPWFTEEGVFAGYVGAALDVTDLRQSNETLQAGHEALERLMHERTASLLVANTRLQHEIAEHKQAEHRLIEQQAQLRALASELSVAEERERRRIATRLHDEIGQVLALTKLRVGELLELDPTSHTRGLIENIRELVDQASQATRATTFELSSPLLYELGLEAAIQSLGEQIIQRHEIRFQFETDHRTASLADDTRIVLFRIARELLVNVHKHARAHIVSVSLRRVGEQLQLSVDDDGVGFEKTDMGHGFGPTGGFGLFSIGEQVRGIGGRLEVVSAPGAGTRVVVAIPTG